jgi:hypothetical protein
MSRFHRAQAVVVLLASSGLLGGCVRFNVPGGSSSASASEKSESGDAAERAKTPSREAADPDTEKQILEAADCTKRPAAKKSGFDPLLPQDVPCAAKRHEKVYLAVTCAMLGTDGAGKTLVPGVEAEAVGLGTMVQDDLRLDLKIKTSSGDEGTILHDCLSRAPIGVSLLPPKKKPANGQAALFGLMKQAFDEAYPLALRAYDIEKKHGFARHDSDEDHFRVEALLKTHNFYTELLHNLTYGSHRELAQVLKDEQLKWMADWPDELSVAYADGLTGKAKDKGVPAVEALRMIVGFGTIARTYDDLRYEEENLERDVADVPESKRATVKQKKLAEIAERRKDTDKKLEEWMNKAKQRKNDVHL